MAVVTVWCLYGWIAGELRWLEHERLAATVLNRDYHTRLAVQPFMFPWPNKELTVDLSELRHGRFYVPITRVNISNATIDQRVWEQLAAFRYLEDLTFRDCRIEPAAKFRLANPSSLKCLDLWCTLVTVERLCEVSQFSHLESLTLDGRGLKGDWLRPISNLRKLQSFTLNNGYLSDEVANSLGHMKELTTLEFTNVKIGFRLGPIAARLECLENLAVDDPSFGDEDMKHLATLKHLKLLYLPKEAAITDAGMVTFEALPNLEQVLLSGAHVSDSGLKHLAHLTKLEVLDIQDTCATNSCLPSLAAIPSLRKVLVVNTAISTSSPGFIGVLDKGFWYPNATRAMEARETLPEQAEEKGDLEKEDDKGDKSN